VLLLTVAILVGVMTSSLAQEQRLTTGVTIQEDSNAGGLSVSNSLLPGNTLSYLSCEAVLFGEPTTATPLFEVKVSPDPNAPGAHWTVKDNTFSYTWNYAEGIKLDFAATVAGNGLRLRYTLTNTTQKTLKRVLVHTCIPTTDAPAFFPGLTKSLSEDKVRAGGYMGIYERAYLWSKGRSFNFAETKSGGDEIHLSFMREGRTPIEWEWWINGPETFDYPFIAVQSKDGKFTTALGFETAEWASINTGNINVCYHLFPLFGDLEPGESETVRGCFYLTPGTPEDALRQFKEDYPGVEKARLGVDERKFAANTRTFNGFEMIRIPPGKFMMGSPSGEIDRYDDEGPQHAVTISKGFWLGKYEVTKRQWKAVMGTEPWKNKNYMSDDPDSPAVYVNWNDTQEFVKRLNAMGDVAFRLPTEAEWEYACRSGTNTAHSFGAGSSQLGDYAWWNGNGDSKGEDYAHVVGLKLPNAWGLYDMHGNVWEWCQDWYGSYTSTSVTDPRGPEIGTHRVNRGGGWNRSARRCRSAHRFRYVPDDQNAYLGFRLAR
jgi:formylglycine-generating enzyme required for sulfatase activity